MAPGCAGDGMFKDDACGETGEGDEGGAVAPAVPAPADCADGFIDEEDNGDSDGGPLEF